MNLSTEISMLAQGKTANVEALTERIKSWGSDDRQAVSWQNVELLCYELAKITETLCVGSYEWPGLMKEWFYIMPNGVAVNMQSLIIDMGKEPDAWLSECGIKRWPNARDLEYIGHRDHWTRTWYWVLATLAVFRANGYGDQGAERWAQSQLAAIPRLQAMVDRILPKAVVAYKRVRGYEPELGELSVSFSSILPPEGKIAVFQRFPCSIDVCPGAISINSKALEQGWGYVETVLTHEIVHYVINSKGNAPHGAEFQSVATLLGVPTEYQD